MGILLGVIGIFFGIALLAQIGLGRLIAAMIAGGIGFAIGNMIGAGWAIFGAILGGLIGIAASNQ